MATSIIEEAPSVRLSLENAAQSVNQDVTSPVIPSQPPAAERSAAGVSSVDSSKAVKRARECECFGTTVTANTLALAALVVTATGLLWTCSFSILSQRWTIRNDRLQDCLNFRQVEITTETCNSTLEEGIPSFWRKRSISDIGNQKPIGTAIWLGVDLSILLFILALRWCKREKPLKLDVERATQVPVRAAMPRTVIEEGQERNQTVQTSPQGRASGYSRQPIDRKVARHRGEEEPKKAIHYCPDCNKFCKRKSDLQRHRDMVHAPYKFYKCMTCQRQNSRSDKMKEHCRKVHGQSRGQETIEVVKKEDSEA